MKTYAAIFALLATVFAGCTLRIEVLPNVKIDQKPTTQPAGPTNYREQWEQIR